MSDKIEPIIHIPILVDDSVNQKIVPGICKALEKFYLSYHTPAIIESFNRKYKSKEIQKSSKTFKMVKENTTYLTEGATINGPSNTAISIEPTWIKVEDGDTVELIGLKVFPYLFSAKTTLPELMTKESKYGSIKSFFISQIRLIISDIMKLKNKIPFLPKSLTGDVKRDILWDFSIHKQIFLLINARDLQDISLNEINLKRLHNMGWGSFVIADDIEGKAIFCMNEFKGFCSILDYNYIYASISKESLKVYTDLNDVKSSVSPLFRMKSTISKEFGRIKATAKLKNYKNEIKK